MDGEIWEGNQEFFRKKIEKVQIFKLDLLYFKTSSGEGISDEIMENQIIQIMKFLETCARIFEENLLRSTSCSEWNVLRFLTESNCWFKK